MTLDCTTAEDTERAGEELGVRLRRGDLLLLEGDLAAGKTTFVRGLVAALGGDPDEVSSPTFVIVQSYPCTGDQASRVHHIDLYRLSESPTELMEIGLEELLSDPDAIVAVEWPKRKLIDWLPSNARLWRVRIDIRDDDTRQIEMSEPAP